MKSRLSWGWLFLLGGWVLLLGAFSAAPCLASGPKNVDFTKGTHVKRSTTLPLHWERWGWRPMDYAVGLSKKIHRKGGVSAFIKLKEGRSNRGFAQLLQFVPAKAYRGKRVQLTGYIKADPKQATWFKLVLGNSAGRRTLEYVRLAPKGPPKHKGWYKIQITQDIPQEATRITIGCGLKGKGPIYCDDFKLAVVNKKTPLTKKPMKRSRQTLLAAPKNLDFTKGTHVKRKTTLPKFWERWGWRPIDYAVGLSKKIHRKGGISAFIKLKEGRSGRGFAQLLQFVSAKKYQGKRVRLTGYIKADPKKTRWFKLILGHARGRRSLQYQRVAASAPADKKGWYKIQITQDIAAQATKITIGCGLKGDGPIYCDDFKLEIVSK